MNKFCFITCILLKLIFIENCLGQGWPLTNINVQGLGSCFGTNGGNASPKFHAGIDVPGNDRLHPNKSFVRATFNNGTIVHVKRTGSSNVSGLESIDITVKYELGQGHYAYITYAHCGYT